MEGIHHGDTGNRESSRSIPLRLSLGFLCLCAVFLFPTFSLGQGPGLTGGPKRSSVDPELEKQMDLNLKVARFYFAKRKAIKAAKGRLMDILENDPDYSKIDEVYYLLGEIALREHKPQDARKYYRKIVDEFVDSQFKKDAEKRLEEISKG